MRGKRADQRSVADHQRAELRAAEAARFFKDCVEHRCEIAGRGIDDTEHVGVRSLLGKRLITFGFEFVALCRQLGKLALKITDGLLEMGQWAIWRRAHLRPR